MAILKQNPATKNISSSHSSLHPPYYQMISEAITTMKDRTGSSQPAIAKFIEGNYPKTLPPTFKKILSIQLKRFVKSEKLVKVKNSYKIAAAEKVKRSSDPVEKKTSRALKHKTSQKATVKVTDKKIEVARKTEEKAKKTKRLSQVKTPEGFKKNKIMAKKGSVGEGKMKKNNALTPVKRKGGPKSVKTGLRTPAKKSKN